MWKELLQWRDDVLRRDGYKCIECGSTNNLEADHIKSFIAYPALRLDLTNGRTLCNDCHKKTTNYGVGVRKEQALVNCQNNPLDREAWIALNKALGWIDRTCLDCGEGHPWTEGIRRCKSCRTMSERFIIKTWLYHWRRFIDWIGEEKSKDDFFKYLIK